MSLYSPVAVSRDFSGFSFSSSAWPAPPTHAANAPVMPWAPGAHPLWAVREVVGDVLRQQHQLLGELPPRGDAARPANTQLLRSMLLQLLYGVPGDALWLEQLQYNLLYRWFVGLDIATPDAVSYERSRQRLRESSAGRILMRCLLLDERMQRLMHDGHFSPDAGMIGSWLAGEQANEALPVSRQTEQRGNRLAQARDYILGHLADPALSADRLAQALCMSRRALFLLFAEQGLTPTRMIQELRLERCRALLDDPQQQNKIIAIALDHGFRDYVTFSRQFKARFGIAPSDFRKRAGAGSLA